jgi:lysophospholipase L1-like esterase
VILWMTAFTGAAPANLVAMSAAVGRRVVLAAALVGAFALAGCGDETADRDGGTVPLFGGTVPADGPAVDLNPSGEAAGRRVVMIGDSITVASIPLLETAANDLGIDLTIDAEVGRRMTVGSQPAAGTEALEQINADDAPADLYVIALGTNDIGKYQTVDEYGAEIAEVLALVPDDAPVVWVNAYLTDNPERSETFNAALLDVLGARGNATVGRWASIAAEDGVLRSDGIHPNEEGVERFADLVVDEIEAWIG